MSENVPRLELLRFLRRVQEQQLQQTDRWIAAEEQRARDAAHVPPPPPDWLVEYGIGGDRRPVRVHVGECHMQGKRSRPANREQALEALAAGVEACTHCRPDTALGVL